MFCLFSITVALVANKADGIGIDEIVPNIDKKSINTLLDILSASMLVISIFAVASMLSAFSSASSTATPRSFKIVVTDDVSQNALSVFIGAFIYGIVANIALDNGFYEKAGRFTLFLFTLVFFVVVILTFLRWVDRISRLGRLEHTIDQLELVASKSVSAYVKMPFRGASPVKGPFHNGTNVKSRNIGYVQHLNLQELQRLAVENDMIIRLSCIPGKFIHRNSILAQFKSDQKLDIDSIQDRINNAILVGDTRLFDEDPRFGFICLTEIASRALSPGINDPGTAIQIIGSHERLFYLFEKLSDESGKSNVLYDRIEVPSISMGDFFTDAFRPIARDGAGNIEVMLRLQKACNALATLTNQEIKEQAKLYSKESIQRSELAMAFKGDLELLRKEYRF